jgi:phosphocarrier protein
MTACKALVRNKFGIHCRPAAIIVKEAQGYPGTVTLGTDARQAVDAKSILMVIGLGMTCGTTIVVTVSGPDEQAMCQRLVRLLETEFDFRREE